jgi:hypothetical protein
VNACRASPSKRFCVADCEAGQLHCKPLYVERVLAPSLRSGQLVVMDNLAAYKAQRIKELIEERGCELLYLSPYSPDLNPIKEE